MKDSELKAQLLDLIVFAEGVKANAELLIQKATDLGNKLGLISASPKQKQPGLSPEQKANVIARRRKNQLRGMAQIIHDTQEVNAPGKPKVKVKMKKGPQAQGR